MDYCLLVSFAAVCCGLAVLWWSGDIVVHYTVKVASAFHITPFFVGFMVLAVAANIPEIAVAISAALEGATDVSAGDIIGGNFSHIAFVLGISMVVAGAFDVSNNDRRRLLSLLGLITVLNAGLFYVGVIYRSHVPILFALYLISIIYVWKEEHKGDGLRTRDLVERDICLRQKKDGHFFARMMRVIKLVIGLLVVFVSSAFTVHYAVDFALLCNLSLHTVGATIVSIGTALPELALCLHAVKQKKAGLILGPMLGNIMGHGTLIIGFLALCSPTPIDLAPLAGTAYFIFSAFFIIGLAVATKRVNRFFGSILVMLFFAYLGYHFLLQ